MRQAYRLTGFQAYRLNLQRQVVCSTIIICSTITGCSNHFAAVDSETVVKESITDSRRSALSNHQSFESQILTLDAGVVMGDRVGYFCVPLTRIGLSNDTQVVSATSSCECVQPKLVNYIDIDGVRSAVLLQYLTELPTKSILESDQPQEDASEVMPIENSQPAILAVTISLVLAEQKQHKFTVNMLHTRLIEELPH